MGSANLTLAAGSVGARARRAVVLRHVDLESLRVGLLGRLPSRLVGFVVEVVRKVFGSGMADFPVRRQASVSLYVSWSVFRCQPKGKAAYHGSGEGLIDRWL